MSRGRPPLKIGDHGRIASKATKNGGIAGCRVRDLDGVVRQVRVIGTSRQDAETNLQEKLKGRDWGGQTTASAIDGETVMSVLAEYYLGKLDESDKSYNTRRRYREVTERYVVGDETFRGLGSVRLREVTPGRLQGHLDGIEKAVGKPTAKLVRANLAGMMRTAFRLGAITSDPMTGVKVEAKKADEVVALTVDEVFELRATLRADKVAVRQDLADAVDVLAATGVRLGELLAIQWADLDLGAEVPTVTITGTIIRKKGEGLVRQTHPKTSASRRRLQLPQFAVDVLLARKVNAGPTVDDVVFASSVGSLRDPTNFRDQWRAARERHGWEGVVPKSFRKAVATLLASDDMSESAAQLGHAGTDVTARHYVAKTTVTPDNRAKLQAFATAKSDD
ncbi:site-specific integrase [Gordonia sp. X0973]|uniref:tyrosine-type recombinase/integrase n=1 Tax=Gordonia sp. X0973 TaxID=2742602 RepID=UPI000F5433C7|nr:site-specific integrase [Gordonia sp. X0973]QKT08030.1 site-specific integrase [Gordonia sp. X0973]